MNSIIKNNKSAIVTALEDHVEKYMTYNHSIDFSNIGEKIESIRYSTTTIDKDGRLYKIYNKDIPLTFFEEAYMRCLKRLYK